MDEVSPFTRLHCTGPTMQKKEELFNLPEEVQWSLMLGLVDSSRHYHYVAFIILIMMVMSEAIALDDAPHMPQMMPQTGWNYFV